ncbi:hypothetical protein OCOL_000728 [Ordospora colligata]
MNKNCGTRLSDRILKCRKFMYVVNKVINDARKVNNELFDENRKLDTQAKYKLKQMLIDYTKDKQNYVAFVPIEYKDLGYCDYNDDLSDFYYKYGVGDTNPSSVRLQNMMDEIKRFKDNHNGTLGQIDWIN